MPLYDNLMKYIRFQMGTLFAFIVTFVGGDIQHPERRPHPALAGAPDQLHDRHLPRDRPRHGEPRPEVMQEKPRKAGEQIMPTPLAVSLGVSGLIRAASVLGRDRVRAQHDQ